MEFSAYLRELRSEIAAAAPGDAKHLDRVDALIREASRLGAAELAAGIAPGLVEIIDSSVEPAIAKTVALAFGLSLALWGVMYALASSLGMV